MCRRRAADAAREKPDGLRETATLTSVGLLVP
jgi:hypothetical protein